MKKFACIFLILVLVFAINVPSGMLSEFGVSPNILLVALLAMVIAGLIAHENLGLVVLVIAVALAANAPPELAASIGYSRDMMLALLVGLILLPVIARQL